MIELSLDYWNALSDHLIIISSLMGGFSIAVIANLLVSETNTRLSRNIMISATIAASSFLVTVFAMTKIFMMTTTGYPMKVKASDFESPRIIGMMAFIVGMIALITMISLAGWTKSKSMGIFTTIVGALTLFFVFLMLT